MSAYINSIFYEVNQNLMDASIRKYKLEGKINDSEEHDGMYKNVAVR